MTREIGRVVGDKYATRISPAWFWVNREYYTKAKGAPEMRTAKNYARVSDWNGAAQIWKALTNHENQKTAAKAMFNLAVANEVLGDINSAVSWSEQSYKKGLNRALSYNNILRQRVFEQERLENQLSKPEDEGSN